MKNIHLLPTENYKQDYTLRSGEVVEVIRLGQLILNKENNEVLLNKNPLWSASCDIDVLVPHHIYITSDEEIKVGDWVIQVNFEKTNTQLLHCVSEIQVKIANDKNGSFTKSKVILTTDQDLIKDGVQEIDNEFIEWFIQNPSCDMVEVSTYHVKGDISGKLHYKITIPQKEPKDFAELLDKCLSESKQILEELKDINAKQQTIEEAAENYAKKSSTFVFQDNHKQDFIAGAKWQAERMYTEDEVRGLLDIQRGNSYVAVLNKTRNVDIASLASSAPEPMGKDGWVKKLIK